MVHTSCQHCIFAEYQQNIQTKCLIGRLDKIIKINPPYEIIQQSDKEKSYYVIQNFMCMYCRSQKWMDEQTNDDLISVIHKEMEIKYTAIVLTKPDSTLADIGITINSLYAQQPSPLTMVVVKHSHNNLDDKKIIDLFDVNKKWRLKHTYNHEFNSVESALMLIATSKVTRNPYYVMFTAGYSSFENYINKINHKINEDLDEIAMILPDKKDNGLFLANTLLFTMKTTNLQSIKKSIMENDSGYMIKKVGDICQQIYLK